MTKIFTDKLVLITGASSGIGRSLAIRLGADRARIALVGRRRNALEETATECEKAGAQRTACFPCDLTDSAAIALVQAVIPGMKAVGAGQIALLTSGAAIWGVPGYAVYSATKAALERIGESLRVELQSHGITVSLVSPSPVDTPMFQTPRIYGDNPWVATAKPRHPDAVAERVVKNLETGAFRIDLSPRASVLRLLAWGAPGSLAALFRHCLRRWAQTGGRP